MHPAKAPQTIGARSEVTVSRVVAWVVFVLLACVSAYGFYSARLFAQYIWTPTGLHRLWWFAAAYAAGAALLIWWRPRWIATVALILAGAYTAVAAGMVAPAAVAYILFSSLMLGKRLLGTDDDYPLALVLGLSLWVGAVSLAVHFPVNYPAAYSAALAVPIFWSVRDSVRGLRGMSAAFWRAAPGARLEAMALAALMFALTAQWLVALKPEVGSDGLAMHLVIPAQVAMRHIWAFEFRQFTWALMPMGGDWSFTIAYLLGGEYAARLLNFSFVVIICGLLARAIRPWVSRASGLLIVALFAATPLVQLETGSLLVENFWAMLSLGAVLALAKFRENGRAADLYAAAILLGSTLAVKFGALAFAVPTLVFVAMEIFRQRKRRLRLTLIAVLCFLVLAAPPYANSWRMTGNPVYPFLNRVFRSPFYDTTTPMRNARYTTPLSWRTPFDATFHSARYLESQDGSLGFQYFLLVPLAVVTFRRTWPYLARTALVLAVAGCVLTFAGQSYLRYIYPALPLFTIAMAQGMARITGRLHRVLCAAMIVTGALNIYFLASSGWYHKDFFLNLLDRAEMDEYLRNSAPVRKLVGYLNRKGGDPRVGFFHDDAIGDLRGQPFADTWHSDQLLARSTSARGELSAARALAITWFIAPTRESGIVLSRDYTRRFLDRFTTPVYTFGKYYLARLRDDCLKGECQPFGAGSLPAPAGTYDDTSVLLVWRGPWSEGTFAPAADSTLTYSNDLGAELEFQFTGTAVTWVYTRAFNRGRAAVKIDGTNYGVVDQYAPEIMWQSARTFAGLAPGNHTLTIRVLGEKSPQSRDCFIDVDRFVVRDSAAFPRQDHALREHQRP